MSERADTLEGGRGREREKEREIRRTSVRKLKAS